jgi:hypothetical protein
MRNAKGRYPGINVLLEKPRRHCSRSTRASQDDEERVEASRSLLFSKRRCAKSAPDRQESRTKSTTINQRTRGKSSAFGRALIATSCLSAVKQSRTFMTFRFAASTHTVNIPHNNVRMENSSRVREK